MMEFINDFTNSDRDESKIWNYSCINVGHSERDCIYDFGYIYKPICLDLMLIIPRFDMNSFLKKYFQF